MSSGRGSTESMSQIDNDDEEEETIMIDEHTMAALIKF